MGSQKRTLTRYLTLTVWKHCRVLLRAGLDIKHGSVRQSLDGAGPVSLGIPIEADFITGAVSVHGSHAGSSGVLPVGALVKITWNRA